MMEMRCKDEIHIQVVSSPWRCQYLGLCFLGLAINSALFYLKHSNNKSLY